MLLRSGNVRTVMHECGKFGAVVLVGNERIGLKHSFEPFTSVARVVPDLDEIIEVAGDLPFVPGGQDRFNA